jgi:hypothetical protein
MNDYKVIDLRTTTIDPVEKTNSAVTPEAAALALLGVEPVLSAPRPP